LGLLVTGAGGCFPLLTGRVVTPTSETLAGDQAEFSGRKPTKESESVLALLSQLSAKFWMFIVGASLLYGAMVPFWFVGAKYLYEVWGFSDVESAYLMSIPELMMVVVAIPWGFMTDKQKWGPAKRLCAAGISCAGVFGSGMVLFKIGFPENRWFAYLLLPAIGSGFAIACTTAWATVNHLNAEKLHSLAGAILGAAINLMPAIVPSFFTHDMGYDLNILAILGVLAALSFFAAAAVLHADNKPTAMM